MKFSAFLEVSVNTGMNDGRWNLRVRMEVDYKKKAIKLGPERGRWFVISVVPGKLSGST